MRALIISQFFWPENFKINDIVSYFESRNIESVVLTSYPHYPNKKKYRSFFNNKKELEYYGKTRIFRVPVISRGDTNVGLIFNYISFVVTSLVFGIWKIRNEKFDFIFIFQTSPATVVIPALFISMIKRKPIFMWVLDLWPETLVSMKVISNKFLIKLISAFMKKVYERCEIVLCQSRSITKIINDLSFKKNAIFFPSWSEKIFYEKKTKTLDRFDYDQNKFNIFFTGNIGKAQDFKTLIEALKIVKFQRIDLQIHIIGDGRRLEWLKNQAKINDLNLLIKFHGSYPVEYMPFFFEKADALFVSLVPGGVFSITIPAKIQTYLLSKKPILGVVEGEPLKIINDSKCGFASKAGEPEALVKNIQSLMNLSEKEKEEMGENGYNYSLENFSRIKLLKGLEDLIHNKIYKDI